MLPIAFIAVGVFLAVAAIFWGMRHPLSSGPVWLFLLACGFVLGGFAGFIALVTYGES